MRVFLEKVNGRYQGACFPFRSGFGSGVVPIRFYALRMHETGFIKSSPQKIIAEGTDRRFLNELKRELKA